MKIRKNNETSFFIENETSRMFFGTNGIDCYIIDLSSDENNKRVFTITNKGLIDFDEMRIFEAFEEFMISMFGNTVLRGEHKSSKNQIDFENKTITIMSDSGNKAILKITYQKNEITFQISKKIEEKFVNHTIYLYSDCNLRGGYIGVFRELFEKLNIITLENEKAASRIRTQ